MKVARSHVIRLNPTPEQEAYFRKACGVARHAYNWALARWKEARAEGKRVKMKDLKAEYNKIKLALSAERVKLSAMKQVRRCCKFVLLHFRKQVSFGFITTYYQRRTHRAGH